MRLNKLLSFLSLVGVVVSAPILLMKVSDHLIFHLILYGSFLLAVMSQRKETTVIKWSSK